MATEHPRERLAGSLLLAFLVAIVLGLGLSWAGQPGTAAKDSRVHEHRAPQQLAQTVVDNRERLVAATAALLTGSAIAGALAATLHSLLRPHTPLLAMFGAIGLFASAMVLLGQAMIYISLWAVVVEFDRSAGATAEASAVSAFTLLELVRTGWAGSLLLFVPISLGATGFSILHSRTMPDLLGWLALLGSVLLLSGWLAYLGGPLVIPGGIGLAALVLWLLITGVWLLARGLRATPQ